MLSTTIPLRPKNSTGPLRVIIIGRVSTEKQDKENIPASYRFVQQFLAQVYHGEVETKCLGEQASGMLAERATIREAEELISSGLWDVVIVEDLSRIYRNPRLQWSFVQDTVDHHTRLIAIADHLDTGDDNWEIMMHTATLRHGLFVPDTRRRVRRTATHSFNQGGMLQKIRYGYRKLTPDEANSGRFGPRGLRMARSPECTTIIQEMRARILRGASYDAVARWLVQENVRPGPYVTNGWTGKLVKELLANQILSGTRAFRTILYARVYKTGKHRRLKNPQGPETKTYPELAHLTPAEHAELLAVMAARQGPSAASAGPNHPLAHRPRARTRWPGQHVRCGVCHAIMHRYGKWLRCQNSFPGKGSSCWNRVQVDIRLLHHKVLPWILGLVAQNPTTRQQVVDAATQEYFRVQSSQRHVSDNIDTEISRLQKAAENLAAAIAQGGQLEALVQKSQEIDRSLQETRNARACLLQEARASSQFLHREEIEANTLDLLLLLADTSVEFADFLRQLIPEFVIRPVQALDCPLVRPRGFVRMSLEAWADSGATVPELTTQLDLFNPPEHIRHLSACCAVKKATPQATLDRIAAQMKIGRMTVKRALAYRKMMEKAGLTEPYRILAHCPEIASRWKKRSATNQHAEGTAIPTESEPP